MPWHVRSTDVSRRTASRLLADAVTRSGDFVGNLHFQPRDDRRALLPNNVEEKTVKGGRRGLETLVLYVGGIERGRVIRYTFIYLRYTRVHTRAIA